MKFVLEWLESSGLVHLTKTKNCIFVTATPRLCKWMIFLYPLIYKIKNNCIAWNWIKYKYPALVPRILYLKIEQYSIIRMERTCNICIIQIFISCFFENRKESYISTLYDLHMHNISVYIYMYNYLILKTSCLLFCSQSISD